MTITELIAQLEQLKVVHGDLPVRYHDNYEGGSSNIESVVAVYPMHRVEWGVEDKSKPAYEIELI